MNKEIDEAHEPNENKTDIELNDALLKFQQAFSPAHSFANADLAMSIYDVQQWFEGIGIVLESREIVNKIKTIGFQMIYRGHVYLYALKNNT